MTGSNNQKAAKPTRKQLWCKTCGQKISGARLLLRSYYCKPECEPKSEPESKNKSKSKSTKKSK